MNATAAVYLIILLAVVASVPLMAATHHLPHMPRKWHQ
jgi:hypothetical protein